MRNAVSAINARTELVPVFTPDPRGWGMFCALSARIQRGVTGEDGGRYLPALGTGDGAYHGDSRLTPQRFNGQAALGAGKPYGGRSDLQQETSTLLADGPMRIYAERLKRTAGTGGVAAAVARNARTSS